MFVISSYFSHPLKLRLTVTWTSKGLALLRAAILALHSFVGPPVFYLNHPAGKPADNSPGGEPYDEIYQVLHLLYPFLAFAMSGLGKMKFSQLSSSDLLSAD